MPDADGPTGKPAGVRNGGRYVSAVSSPLPLAGRVACSALASEMAARTAAHGLRREAEAARRMAGAPLPVSRAAPTEFESRGERMGRLDCVQVRRAYLRALER